MTRWRGEDVRLVLLGTHLNRPQERTWADWKRVLARILDLGPKGDAPRRGGFTPDPSLKSNEHVRRRGFGRIGEERRIGS